MIKKTKLTLLAGALLSLSAGFAQSADHTLTISSWAPPTHGINSLMWPKFIEMVEEATDGRVTAEIKMGLAPPPGQMDLVQDGAADATIIFHGYQSGRFTATKLIELPGYEGSAEAASVAYWRVYDQYLSAANEHRGVKVMALHTHGPAYLQTAKPVTSLAEFADLKVRVPGGVGSEVGAALGVVGIQVPAPKVYETLASNAADGVVMPLEGRKGFKLTEVAQNIFEIPGGMYRGSFAYIMNEDAFDSLPQDLQEALDEKVFGEPLSRELGKIWDAMDKEGREVTMNTADNAINAASDADITAFKGIQEQVIAKVLEEISSKGIDAQAAYDMVVKEMGGS